MESNTYSQTIKITSKRCETSVQVSSALRYRAVVCKVGVYS